MDVLPERVAAGDERVVQVVGDLAPAFARRQQRLAGRAHAPWQVADVDDVALGPTRSPARRRSGARGRCRASGSAGAPASPRRRSRSGACDALEQVIDQHRDVLAALAQRRHVHMDDAQAVEQILAELAGRDALGQVAGWSRRRRGRWRWRSSWDPTDWISPVSRKRRSSACMRRLISPTSSRKSVPPCAMLQLAGLVAVGAGEAALHVPEELRFEQRFGQPRAVDRDERPVARLEWTWTVRAMRSLPTPLSPVIEHLRFAGGRAARHGEDLEHRRAGRDNDRFCQTLGTTNPVSGLEPLGYVHD